MIHRLGATENGRPIYGLTLRAVALSGVVVGAVMAGLLLGVLALARSNDSASKAERGADQARVVGSLNCKGVKGLAHIQRALVERQAAQTALILKKGVTFGIPAAQLPKLIAEGKASQDRFLAELDDLARRSCTLDLTD